MKSNCTSAAPALAAGAQRAVRLGEDTWAGSLGSSCRWPRPADRLAPQFPSLGSVTPLSNPGAHRWSSRTPADPFQAAAQAFGQLSMILLLSSKGVGPVEQHL